MLRKTSMVKYLPAPKKQPPKLRLQYMLTTALYVLLGLLFVINTSAADANVNSRFIQPPWARVNTAMDHIEYAQQLWRDGYTLDAQRELAIGKEMLAGQNTSLAHQLVLGASDMHATIENWEAQRSAIAESIQYWQEIIHMYPNYRDAYVSLGYNALQLNNVPLAQEYLNTAAVLDPNYPLTHALQELIQAGEGNNQ